MNNNYILELSKKQQLSNVIKSNEYTSKYGLTLSNEDAQILVTDYTNSLKDHRRFEFGGETINKIIFAFCDSPYIYQDNYVDTIGRLVDIFYLFKNESLDELSDDELLEFMRREFDKTCQGDIDYLEGTVLPEFTREMLDKTQAPLKLSIFDD